MCREVKGKVYKAYVKEKKEAKADYDQAVQYGQAAGHVALESVAFKYNFHFLTLTKNIS